MIACRGMVPAVLTVVLLAGGAAGGAAGAQDSDRPREFAEFRGAWMLDEKATEGLRATANRAGESLLFDAAGMPVARRIVITTTATEISLTKDVGLPASYRFDGSETQMRDARTGAPLAARYRLTLVADALALTETLPGTGPTRVVTDAYSLQEWDVLIVHRTLSYVAPEGHLRTLAGARNYPHRLVYRRQGAGAVR
jgi:hypothetical protein